MQDPSFPTMPGIKGLHFALWDCDSHVAAELGWAGHHCKLETWVPRFIWGEQPEELLIGRENLWLITADESMK